MNSRQAEEPEPATELAPDEELTEDEEEPPEESESGNGKGMKEGPRTWVMVALTAIFVGLYLASLFGWIKVEGEIDESLLHRLEPILFAIIGYYFGRVPSERSERRLEEQVESEEQERERAERAETRQRVRAERAETRIQSARLVLATGAGEPEQGRELEGKAAPDPAAARQAAAAAIRILS